MPTRTRPRPTSSRCADARDWFFEVDDTYWLFELTVQSAILGERGANEWPPRYKRWSAGQG